jgi:leucyl-tRNA---protein transferase
MSMLLDNDRQFYLTTSQSCSYLPGEHERKVFVHLKGDQAPALHDMLTQHGFRRSQSIAYRPACESCQACVSVRVVVDAFEPSATMRKTLRLNRHLLTDCVPNRACSEHYDLFRSYTSIRHPDGGMAVMSVLDFTRMVEESPVRTHLMELRPRSPDSAIHGRGDGPLVGAAILDELRDGFSMVYSYYDPEKPERSLGTELILRAIALTRLRGLPYLYLGYWVKGSDNMAYKARFLPQERLSREGWKRVERVEKDKS